MGRERISSPARKGEFRSQELQELHNFLSISWIGLDGVGRLGGAWRHLRGGLPYPLWNRILGRQYEAMGFLPDYQVHECLRWFCHVIKMAR